MVTGGSDDATMAVDDFTSEWQRYALERIRLLVDKDRQQMTDAELSIYTFANNALAGGDPTIAMFERGPGFRLCRVCGAEWHHTRIPEHVAGCPVARLE
jgi:hypothetical protein